MFQIHFVVITNCINCVTFCTFISLSRNVSFSFLESDKFNAIYIYIHSNEIHNVVALIKCLLVLRCQLYMFRTVTVHPQ